MIVYLVPKEGPLMVGRSPDGKWRCLAWLSLNERNELVAYRVEVRPWTGEVISLGTDVLRYLPLHRWLAEAHSSLTGPVAAWLREGGVPARSIDRRELRRLRKEAERMVESTPPRPGRKGFGTAFYRRLALEYLELQSDGVSRGIRVALADRESARQGKTITTDAIRDALHKATELGFLLPGTRGRAGRLPGPNLYVDEQEGVVKS